MIIATLTLGGAILGATTLAGLLMLYQIRATTDQAYSAQAIFAADSGVNWALYDYYQKSPPADLPVMSNGATITVVCSDDSGNVIACNTSATTTAISKGAANTSRRAFFINLATATTTLP